MRRETKRAAKTNRGLHNRKEKLAHISLVRQIEVLYEDNRQLRAAVMIYREVVRKLGGTV